MDADAFFALYVSSDLLHQGAKEIFTQFLKSKARLYTTNLVLQEVETVISYRLGQKSAKDFLKRFNKINIEMVFVNKVLTAKAWLIFKKQTKRGTSFIDCANLAIAQELKIDKIFSFDKFYQRVGLKTQILF